MDFTSNPASGHKAGSPRHPVHRWIAATTAIGAFALLASCAGEPPRETMSKAELAVNQASQVKATEFAALELRKAQDHLQQAKQKVQDEEYEDARRLAEKAIAEAEVAEAKTESETAKNSVAELVDSLKALQKELESRSQ